MSRPLKSEEIEVTIDSLAFGGRGVTRIDGFVIFVEGAVPGDRVRAVITKSRASYAEARTIEVLNPSAARIEPACRHFGECGGCQWQTLRYQEQLGYKERQVSECLAHIGGLSGVNAEASIPAEPLWRYRNKVEFSFARGAGGPELGFHPPGDWRRVVAIDDCLLHSELTNRIRNHVRALVRDSGIDAWDQKGEDGFWRHLVIREGINTGEVMVNIVTSPGEFPDAGRFADALAGEFSEIASLVWSINRTRASVATGLPFRVLAGRDHIFEVVGGLKLKVAPSTFMQTNTLMAERLYTRALEYADAGSGDSVFDLYSGIGSIALLMARSARQVLGIEISG
ncbi:MAG: 23S rRNA (uracil(1939)-C(5))-methyltransferase RlmD, partial [Actinomycetota bacterium]